MARPLPPPLLIAWPLVYLKRLGKAPKKTKSRGHTRNLVWNRNQNVLKGKNMYFEKICEIYSLGACLHHTDLCN